MQTFLDCVLKLAPFWKRPSGTFLETAPNRQTGPPPTYLQLFTGLQKTPYKVALVREAATLQIEYDLDNIVKDLGVANFNFSYFKKVNKMKLKIHNSGNY